jgi:propionyl-CoA synthetase
MAATLLSLGVKKGDRVLVYMPMIPEAAFAMLACTRIGALHSVVFGGFASVSLASRIDDATRRSSSVPTPAAAAARWCPTSRCWTKPSAGAAQAGQGADGRPRPGAFNRVAGPRRRLRRAGAKHLDTQVPCEWVDATHPSYTLYTSGTTGKPKGVQRDTGGYAVALAASMKHIYCGNRARPTSAPATSAGWWATATSSTAR